MIRDAAGRELRAKYQELAQRQAAVHSGDAQEDINLLVARVEVLETSTRKVLEGFDQGVFVRNTSRDRETGWALRLVPYITALATLQEVLGAPAAGEAAR